MGREKTDGRRGNEFLPGWRDEHEPEEFNEAHDSSDGDPTMTTRGSTADTIQQEASVALDTSDAGLPRWPEMVCALSRSNDLTRDIFHA